MARVDNLKNYLADVGKAIKDKKGDQTNIKASEFDNEISKIESIEDYISSKTINNLIAPTSDVISRFFISKIKKIPNLDLTDINNREVLKSFFGNMVNLTEIPEIKLNEQLDEVDLEYALNNCRSISNIDNFVNAIKNKKIINARFFLRSCYNVRDISSIQYLDFLKCTSFDSAFQNIQTDSIPLFDINEATNFNRTFSGCLNLISIPKYNTSRGNIMANMFSNTLALQTVPELDFSSAQNITNIFEFSHDNLTDLGGFKNLGFSYNQKQANYVNYKLDLSTAPNLTEESLMNVINNLYDLNQVYTEQLYSQQLVLGATNLAKLSEEQIAIATNKGWTVS